MDWNNHPDTKFEEVKKVLKESIDTIKQQSKIIGDKIEIKTCRQQHLPKRRVSKLIRTGSFTYHNVGSGFSEKIRHLLSFLFDY